EDAPPEWMAEVFSGNRLIEGMEPYAACYGGHQFGRWAGQLGDGRAITLGEVVRDGRRLELQLKGAGPTPYSRMGDGRAVMRSSVREFLCSEAMHHLGVPTTRALTLVATGEEVVRDVLYDGNARPEPGAIVCRVAPSFLRFGNFEILAAREEHDVLAALADYTITTHFPELGAPSREVYARWLAEIARRTAMMIVGWMRVGFVHGVMNTDNMSVLGLTIDYGPYGWLEGFDPSWTPNTTDAGGRRYCFGEQPRMAWWNLVCFANALVPVVGAVEPLQEALRTYPDTLERERHRAMLAKLGLREDQGAPREADVELVDALFEVLQRVETDMTIFFRKLAQAPIERMPALGRAQSDAPSDVLSGEQSGEQVDDAALASALSDAFYTAPSREDVEALGAWTRAYAARARAEGLSHEARRARMDAVNPKYVLRNYLAQLAIDEAEQGDGRKIGELLEVLRRPYDEQPEHETYAAKRPEWARHRVGCSMLSCSS
ncbi:MAG: YdiU family protein, partial [Sandaracinaceae bacterium]|nr:YdiU family protein [Sandaracinaceae bacterium]